MASKRHKPEEIVAVGAQTAYIEPGSPWENGYCESFNSKLRDELLNGEILYSLSEAQVLSRPGDATSTPRGHTARSNTSLLRLKSSSHAAEQSCRGQAPARPNLGAGKARATTIKLDHPMGADRRRVEEILRGRSISPWHSTDTVFNVCISNTFRTITGAGSVSNRN